MNYQKSLALLVITTMLGGCAALSGTDTYRDQSATQLFNTAETALAKKNYSSAVKAFEALDSMYPFGPQAEQAQLDLIYAYYKADEMPSAVAAADRYIRLYPRGSKVDYAYYLKGLANLEQDRGWLMKYYPVDPAQREPGTALQAFQDFAALVRLFPDSRYVPLAKRHMFELRNQFAKHEIQVANYYLEREAYVSAANRASYVIQHFQSSPLVADALIILIKANKAMGLEKAADDARRVLQLNYPKSAALI